MEKEDKACSAGTAGGRREEGASDAISLDKVRGRKKREVEGIDTELKEKEDGERRKVKHS